MIIIPEKQHKNTEINITSMLDMVFILLIFFIVTASFTPETGLDITKPTASTSKKQPQENILLGVNKEQQIFINEAQVNLNTLQNILSQYVQKNTTSTVIIVADEKTPIAFIVEILDRCNLAGVNKTSISTKQK